MMKKIMVVMTAAALPFAMSVNADGRTVEQVYKECGLGGAIFGKSSPVLAFISNVTWDLGTTAALSEASSPESCTGNSVKAAVLIKEAFPAVEQELAMGSGDHVAALNSLMACDAASLQMRASYAEYTDTQAYSNASQAENIEQLFKLMNDSMKVASCSAS